MSFQADSLSEAAQRTVAGLPVSTIESVPLAESRCSLCHQKVSSLSELEQHMRLHQPPPPTSTASATTSLFPPQVGMVLLP